MIESQYPFQLGILNKFNLGKTEGVNVSVIHFYFPFGTDGSNPNNKLEQAEVNIKPGQHLVFPLFWNQEYVRISISDAGAQPGEPYYIWAGFKSKCYIEYQEPIIKEMPSPLGEGKDNHGSYKRGATWEFPPGKKWNLDIRKYGPDPADEDVVIGPGTPG